MSAEPYGAEEIASVEREFADIARTQPLASGAMAIRMFETAARLLATVRAREADRDRARDEARLWRAYALAQRSAHRRRMPSDTIETQAARRALRAAGIDPDAA